MKVLFLIILLVVAASVAGAPVAQAVGAAYFPQDTTITLISNSYTIVGVSDADEVSTDSSTLLVKISGGQKFTLRSTDKHILTNDGGYTYTCGSSYSELVIWPSSNASQRTVRVTPDAMSCASSGGGGGGGSVGDGGSAQTSTTATTPLPTSVPTALHALSTTPARHGLSEGDVVRAAESGDPDVYIVNAHGAKRLFLNVVIFNYYGHLGGFAKVKSVSSATRDAFVTSGLFRNCETNDPKVYGVEITAEDGGTLHWVNTTGAQAVADDPDFFKKVFCINSKEFNWYPHGSAYTSVLDIPKYTRASGAVAGATTALDTIKVSNRLSWLNVRQSPSTSAAIVGKVYPNDTYSFTEQENGWYKIQKYGNDFGWVSGQYVIEL